MLIIGISFWEIGSNFDSNVHSMEEDLSVLVIKDMAVLDGEGEDTTDDNAKKKNDLLGRNEISVH